MYQNNYTGFSNDSALLFDSGKIVNRYQYDEWGNILHQEEQLKNPIRYSGEYYEEESGLYYLRVRYYDPSTGRFISRDSYEGQLTNPLSLNLYTYCYNNPLKYLDPMGHIAWDVADVSLAILSWEEYRDDPSLGNLGWAVVDSVGALPVVPSVAAYLKRGSQVIDKAKDLIGSGLKFLTKGADEVKL